MTRKKKNKKLEVEYHAVTFIDLLGQQEQLRKLTSLPDEGNQEQFHEMIETLKNTYGAVKRMRLIFKQFFDGFKGTTINPKDVPKEKRRFVKEMTNNPIRFHQFSDFVVAFLSLRTDKGAKLPLRGIYGMIGATAATTLTSLASGHPVRGGIDIGISMELKHNEIYGASLAKAYALESHIAIYPRVVIGNELNEYLVNTSNQIQSDEISSLSAKTAAHCLDMLTVDSDGHLFVDFMGKEVREKIGGENIGPDIVQKAYEFVSTSYKQFQDSDNTKIALKYEWLKNYMEPRLKLWGVQKR